MFGVVTRSTRFARSGLARLSLCVAIVLALAVSRASAQSQARTARTGVRSGTSRAARLRVHCLGYSSRA